MLATSTHQSLQCVRSSVEGATPPPGKYLAEWLWSKSTVGMYQHLPTIVVRNPEAPERKEDFGIDAGPNWISCNDRRVCSDWLG